MTLKVLHGDLLNQKVDAIINTVNCVGVMGKGIALQFKNKWPENYKAYEKACKAGQVRTGRMFVFELGALADKPHFIINFPTKDHWREKSKIEYIEDGLRDLVDVIKTHHIKSIAVPPLGCGNGGLRWDVVRPLIEKHLLPLDNQREVLLFEPKGAPPASDMVVNTPRPAMTVGRAVLIALLSGYKEFGYLLSKLEVQKIAYFASVADVLPRLNYSKNRYGPYSEALNHALQKMNGHFITGFGDNDTSEAQITVLEDAISQAYDFLGEHKALSKLKEIQTLIDGFETPLSMETLATVHWAAKEVQSSDIEQVKDAVYHWHPEHPEWGKRKQSLMPESHIRIALDRLKTTGWIN